MATAAGPISGRCLCGAVRFSFEPAKREVGVCNCSICRRWSAGPFLVLDHEGPVAFEGVENVGVYKSSEWGERGFCKTCGTSLYWRMSGVEHFAVSAGALDDQTGLAFTTEIFIDEKPGYYAFADPTHKMTGEEFVAAFAAGKETGQG
jgi:hypothetical protein